MIRQASLDEGDIGGEAGLQAGVAAAGVAGHLDGQPVARGGVGLPVQLAPALGQVRHRVVVRVQLDPVPVAVAVVAVEDLDGVEGDFDLLALGGGDDPEAGLTGRVDVGPVDGGDGGGGDVLVAADGAIVGGD